MSLADVSVAMLVVGPRERDAADPAMVRLVDQARSGDRAAFGRLLEGHLAAARRLALAAVGQISDADEAVQEASVAAWQRLHNLQDPSAFRAWFMRIVWRKALDRRRSIKAWFDRFGSSPIDADSSALEYPDSDPLPEEVAISRELASAITQVIRSLPGRLRDPFLLAASGDHRYEEIAGLLKIPVGTVKWRISEARRVIRLKLTRLGHGGPR